jgi:hypothetical protein
MSLEDSLRWAQTFPMRHPAEDASERPRRELRVNWSWVKLWLQENPDPRTVDKDAPGFDEWYAEYRKMNDRVWVAASFPEFLVWDWSDEDVAIARRLVSRHVCGVCGQVDDPSCGFGC